MPVMTAFDADGNKITNLAKGVLETDAANIENLDEITDSLGLILQAFKEKMYAPGCIYENLTDSRLPSEILDMPNSLWVKINDAVLVGSDYDGRALGSAAMQGGSSDAVAIEQHAHLPSLNPVALPAIKISGSTNISGKIADTGTTGGHASATGVVIGAVVKSGELNASNLTANGSYQADYSSSTITPTFSQNEIVVGEAGEDGKGKNVMMYLKVNRWLRIDGTKYEHLWITHIGTAQNLYKKLV